MNDNKLAQQNPDDSAHTPLSPAAEAWGTQRAFEILSEKVARYEAALQWYADVSNHMKLKDMRDGSLFSRVGRDYGERARTALGEKP